MFGQSLSVDSASVSVCVSACVRACARVCVCVCVCVSCYLFLLFFNYGLLTAEMAEGKQLNSSLKPRAQTSYDALAALFISTNSNCHSLHLSI